MEHDMDERNNKNNAIEVENTFIGPEIHYCVVFKGKIKQFADLDEVKTVLGIHYKINEEKIAGAFSGKPVTIVGPTDFQTAVDHRKRLRAHGAVCSIEAVEPPESFAAAWKEKVEESHKKQNQNQEPEQKQNQLQFNDLYTRLNEVYLQVQSEYNIAEKSKKYENKEVTGGCLGLLSAAAAVAAVIFTPLAWYWAGLGILVIIVLLGSLIKDWNVDYAKDFLARMEKEKQKDPSFFAFTLGKWVTNLPKNDRAKKYLESVIQIMPTADLDHLLVREALDQYRPSPTPTYETKKQETQETTVSEAAVKPAEDMVYCPRCGSDWIRTMEKRPGKIIYFCENCSKKWRPKRRR
ncbi:MAG: hypothetical protein GTO45_33230 [Candidatus Aminicenantes bacterium]|nr:hypothetical protein [Candidatus Aminicenantes bacterium]NIM83600.1 hypothetical protein [Candidatus Aminicenantes bacterium]NIN23004.1 hypothetical protein [Candidatus Aminicenantes bacterium]NIN46741.1 hypothetical protein [Candidatus Aminicenantes bacterium]NIN89647.1 hypothetical protein [Candidatus Aminicenantes bacterium]